MSATRRVLVIDDQRAIHQDFSKILVREEPTSDGLDDLERDLFGEDAPVRQATPSGPSFAIDSAYQGRDGLDMVKAAQAEGRPYDLAFVDVRMPPGWDGVETIERLWKEDPNLQIVLCTAFADYDWGELMSRVGGRDNLLILRKPVDPVEVLQAAAALSRKWQLRHESEVLLQTLENQVRARTADLESANQGLQAAILERDRMEAELRLAQKLEAMGQLAAGVAHEINTPLQFIGDNLSFLREAFGDLVSCVAELSDAISDLAERDDPVGVAARNCQDALEQADLEYLREAVPKAFSSTLEGVSRTTAIVRSLKEFSHPSSKERVPTDLNHSLQTTLDVARSEYKYAADVDLSLGEIPAVPCFQGEINQVLLNIIVNAAHAMTDVLDKTGQRGRLAITTRADDDHVVVTIGDTGGGIPESIRESVYDPFFTTKPVGKGTGQGLAIARRIVVEKHGGRLDFAVEEGIGTTFEIRLPLRPAQEEPGMTEGSRANGPADGLESAGVVGA